MEVLAQKTIKRLRIRVRDLFKQVEDMESERKALQPLKDAAKTYRDACRRSGHGHTAEHEQSDRGTAVLSTAVLSTAGDLLRAARELKGSR